ncbi:hypothetical protein ACH4U5_39395 [Streptomyces sp. NPDC020858]|uniref:hypothetical protein n=1 Tax=Streptomyces sp. NPDC020858 TaxID=3365097 RepID=UPI0037A2165E
MQDRERLGLLWVKGQVIVLHALHWPGRESSPPSRPPCRTRPYRRFEVAIAVLFVIIAGFLVDTALASVRSELGSVDNFAT